LISLADEEGLHFGVGKDDTEVLTRGEERVAEATIKLDGLGDGKRSVVAVGFCGDEGGHSLIFRSDK
jgi:hypothetical protein